MIELGTANAGIITVRKRADLQVRMIQSGSFAMPSFVLVSGGSASVDARQWFERR